MMKGKAILLFLSTVSLAWSLPAPQKVKEPAKQDYVYIQSGASGARTISKKSKYEDLTDRKFETAHKLPAELTLALNDDDEVSETISVKPVKHGKKVHKRQAPAPPGAIKINVAQLLEKYKQTVQTSTSAPSTTTKRSTTTRARRRPSIRSRRELESGPTTSSPVLTTQKIAPKRSIDSDVVVGAASEKQRSRIQIKKGPNGQDYEYEYVYYYYDEDDDPDKKTTNAHDGPARNTISRSDKPTPEANEVLPARGKPSRGRQLGEEDPVQEERLPANTRFPPRSRNLNTTPLPEEEPKPAASRTRGRGRPATEATRSEDDNISDETQATRGRTRANVRRPSLELVDSESFNTHSSSASSGASSPTFPAQLPAGPDEVEDRPFQSTKQPANDETTKPDQDGESTTIAVGMNKVALDLYAISQGTQKLFGEEAGSNTDDEEATTPDISTEETETTTVTTTTTTTTTTPAPTTPRRTTTTTTTTTTEAPTKASRFGGRRTSSFSGRKTSTTTTEAPASESSRPKKFGRPSFGGRSRVSKPTPAPVEEEAHKEESKLATQSKPGRSRFGSARPRGRTTAAPEAKEESSTAAPASHRPSLPRSRPSFNSLRGRGRSTTVAPATEEGAADSEASFSEPSSTTTSRPSRRIAANPNIKPLRPGPRLNIGGRRGLSTTTTEAPAEDHVTGDEEEAPAETNNEKEETPAPAPVDNSPIGRLRNRNRLNIQPKAKPASAASASSQVQVRRINPLLNRRKQSTEAPSSEAPSSAATEAEAEEAVAETDVTSSSTSTTTEEPRGLSRLLAGRRRMAARTPGTINHK